MKRNILLLFAVISISQYVSAQVVFNFGPELGAGISRLWKSSSSSSATVTSYNDKTKPLIGPLGGIYIQMIVNKILLFNTGIQYELSGQHFTSNEEAMDTKYSLQYTSDITQNQTFQKICLPVSAGITFPVFKVHLSLFGGWRGNYFISGKYYYNSSIVYPAKPSYNNTVTYDYSPLDTKACPEYASSFNNQVFFGLSVSKKRLEFALYSYIGLDINYTSNTLINAAGAEYKNNDFVLAVRYRFYGFRNVKVHCNIFAQAN
jgi:Outer membrane protein beta-barrel domain